MKILYVANDRHAAQLAANALRDVAVEVRLAWAGSLSAALRWVSDNRDVGVIIVEAEVQNQNCASFVGRVRALGLGAPVIVVAPDRLGTPLEAIRADADDYVVASSSLFSELPTAVRRELQRASAAAHRTTPPLRLLYVGDATLARRCLEHRQLSIEIVEGSKLPEFAPTEVPLPFDILLVEHDHDGLDAFGLLKSLSVRGLKVPVIVVVDWDEKLAMAALRLGAVDCVVKSADALRALLFKLDRGLPHAMLPREQAERAKRFRESEARFQAAIDEERARRETLETRLVEAAAALQAADERQAAVLKTAAADFSERHGEYEAGLSAAAAARDVLEKKLAAAQAALQQVQERASIDRVTAAQEAKQRATDFETMVAEATATRGALEEKLAESEAARQEAEQRYASELTASAAHFAGVQSQYEAGLSAAAAVRGELDEKLSAASAAVQRAEACAASDRAAAEQKAAQREAEFQAYLAQDASIRKALEQKLSDAQAAVQRSDERDAARQRETEQLQQQLLDARAAVEQADQRRSSDAAAAADQLARRSAEFTASLADVARSRDQLAEQMSEVAASLEDAQKARLADATAAAEHLARREEELGATLADARASQSAVEQQFADREAAHQRAEQQAAERHREIDDRHKSELAAAASRLADREAEHENALAEAAAARTALEEQLADAQVALRRVDERASVERAAAEQHAAERLVEFEARIAQAAALQHSLEQKLAEAAAAHQQAEHHAFERQRQLEEQNASALTTAAAEFAARQAGYETRLADTAAGRMALERQLADAQVSLQRADERAAVYRAAAERQAAQRQAEFEEKVTHLAATKQTLDQKLAEAAAMRQALEQKFADAAAAHQQAEQQAAHRQRALEQQHESALTAAAADLAERQARHDADVAAAAAARTALEEQHAELGAMLTVVTEKGNTLEHRLADTAAALQLAEDGAVRERSDHERARAASEAQHQRLAAEYAEVQRTLDQVRADFQALARLSSEHASERARLGTVVTERDAQIREHAERHLAAQQAARDALTRVEETLRQTQEASRREVAQLQTEIKALGRELEATRTNRDALRAEADRVPDLRTELEESRTEIRRQFEHTPYGLCRWRRDGTVVHVNRALVRLLGYRTADDVRALDFSTAVFESADDLSWLTERCLGKNGRETLETTWRRKDGGRRVVRLVALAVPPDLIEVVTEDLTDLRALEEKLRQAQRMESVGRLASEVAVTCDNLLRDVSQDGQQWLDAIGSDTPLRNRGEHLLGEVTRAAGFLRQLAAYGKRQSSAVRPVAVNQVLRDIEPVLKRLAGDDIEFVLPKTSLHINVDVEAERLERILVNVVIYARQRMPSGGRLKIDIASAVADRKFVARYPNVRPGPHALITVTEVKDAERPVLEAGLADDPPDAGASRPSSEKPGVDLGALLALIGDCGGHLWMSADPPGNMVLRIHLPKPATDRRADAPAPVTQSERGRSRARWFGH